MHSSKSDSVELPSKRMNENSAEGPSICRVAQHIYLALPSSTDCSPPFNELFVQLGRLHHTNEHEYKSTPSAQNLDGPPTCLGWEDWQFSTSAVSVIPEIIAIHVTLPLGAISPWRESSSFARLADDTKIRCCRT